MRFNFSHEPVAWLTFVAVVATILIDVINKQADLGTAVNAFIVALGGVVARQTVSSPATVRKLIEEQEDGS